MTTRYEQWASDIIDNLPGTADDREPKIEDRPAEGWDVVPWDYEAYEMEGRLHPINPDDLWDERPTEAQNVPLIDIREDDFESSARDANRRGFEAWAFYKSIHLLRQSPFPGHWGIFLLDSGIATIRDLYLHTSPTASPMAAQLLGMRVLHRHERFHFHVDSWVISQEAFQKQALYLPYLQKIYQRVHPGRLCVEEALANKHMVRSLSRHGVRGFLESVINCQPPAYQIGDSYAALRAELAAQVLDLKAGRQPRHDLSPWIAQGRGSHMNQRNCPTFIVERCVPSRLMPPAAGFPVLKEIKRFIKEYLNGRLVADTDHEFWRIDNGTKIKMPNRHSGVDRLKPHEFKNIVGKSGLTAGGYWKERVNTNIWKRNVPRQAPMAPRL